MHAEQLVANMDQTLYLRLKEAVETSRWEDGQPLTDQQREDTLTLVMLYQARHLNQDEPFSIDKSGQFIQKSKVEISRSQADEITRFQLNEGSGVENLDR